MQSRGLMGSTSEIASDGPWSFPGKPEYKFAFQISKSDILNFLLKTNVGET